MFHRIFEETAGRSPTALAIKAGQRRLSYAELDAWANEIACIIRSLTHANDGSNKATFVGLCMPRGIEATAGVLGILKAGCAWVPLDPSYPEDRLRFMLEDTAAPVVLTLESTIGAAFLQQSGCALVSLDAPLPSVKETQTLLPDDPERAAYVIYTSGSTGRPKGVVGSHAAMLSRFEWMWQEFPFERTEVCCGKTALNFVELDLGNARWLVERNSQRRLRRSHISGPIPATSTAGR